ncbi:MAG TPA: DUF2202 domain-containing protein [Lamprocystis sp. (in: g-proteobacteria)]|nr:DUF2202 domain-containing protein [Lamprocystis sp. (in: g-proteobacteria)]
MKNRMLINSLVILACASAGPVMAKGPTGPGGPQAVARGPVTVPTLTDVAADDLLKMREEEKVARDVYIKLYARWKTPVFSTISASEQIHFDALGAKIVTYRLTDPALPGLGEFTNTDLQNAYDQLSTSGLTSSIQALIVGATIEDMDIDDLQNAIADTDQAALKTTYQNLLEGSKNHLRAFVRLLRAAGVQYRPQYIDETLFDAIVGV